jgi:hemerythrin-like metal-binding protein
MDRPKSPASGWSTVFETGNAALDLQHRQLIADSNRLKEKVLSGGSWSEIRAELAALIKNCAEHFRYEERVLRETDFPRHAEHVVQHQRIEAILKEFAEMVANVDGNDSEHRDLVASLELKIIEIIVRHDLDYKSHLMDQAGY